MARRHIRNGLEAVLDIRNVIEADMSETVWVRDEDAGDLIRQVTKLSDEPVEFVSTDRTVGVYLK